MGISLKLHKISKKINYWHVGTAFLLGFILNPLILGGSELDKNTSKTVVSTLEDIKKDINLSSVNIRDFSNSYTEVSLRDLKTQPQKYYGKNISVKGHSNDGAHFIKNNGYMIDMDCSDYQDFAYYTPKGFQVYGKLVETESGPKLICNKYPKALQ